MSEQLNNTKRAIFFNSTGHDKRQVIRLHLPGRCVKKLMLRSLLASGRRRGNCWWLLSVEYDNVFRQAMWTTSSEIVMTQDTVFYAHLSAAVHECGSDAHIDPPPSPTSRTRNREREKYVPEILGEN